MKEWVFTVRIRAYEDEFTATNKSDAVASALTDGENYSISSQIYDATAELVCVKNVDPQEEG